MALTKREKLMFPVFLLAFELVFLILFGVLVQYDDNGGPLVANGSTTSQLTQQNTVKVYPCKPIDLFISSFYPSVYNHVYVRVC